MTDHHQARRIRAPPLPDRNTISSDKRKRLALAIQTGLQVHCQFKPGVGSVTNWLMHKLSIVESINFTSFVVLIATFLIAGLITFIGQAKDRSWRGLWHHLLPPTTLTHRSSRADIIFWIVKHLLKPLWIFPVVLSSTSIGTVVHATLADLLPIKFQPTAHPSWWLILVFTITMIVVNDLSYYVYHRAQHSYAWLWEFHKVHHSAERMVGTTDGRVHPIDDLLYYVWNGLFAGCFFGMWLFVIVNPVMLAVLGLNALIWTHILTFGYVKHLPYGLSFGWLNKILVSPLQHHLHHSVDPAHYNRNYGILLSVWDRMLGTACDPKPGEQFVFGLANNEAAQYHSTVKLFTLPLINIWAMIKRAVVNCLPHLHRTRHPPIPR
jgi:sterol desaturase/sphingolipid hydroxylase (fatty acid hydroxylase superfamily)